MLNIGKIFGRSPFSAVQAHMEKVKECLALLPKIFASLDADDLEKTKEIAREISKKEHEADLIKNDIRNHLPKSIFLPIDHGQLLEILSIQDSLADEAEDLAILLTIRALKIPEALRKSFFALIEKNLEAFHVACEVINELQELLESTFGGYEAEKVGKLVDQVAFIEHEGDLLQRDLLTKHFQEEENMSAGTFILWLRIFEKISAISNQAEKLANRIRMTLDLK